MISRKQLSFFQSAIRSVAATRGLQARRRLQGRDEAAQTERAPPAHPHQRCPRLLLPPRALPQARRRPGRPTPIAPPGAHAHADVQEDGEAAEGDADVGAGYAVRRRAAQA